MKTITINQVDKSHPLQISPTRLKQILAMHGIEDGEVINIELKGDKVILVVAVPGSSDSPPAVIEEVDDILLAHTSIIGNQNSAVQTVRDEHFSHLMNW